jgi:transcriptional regulator with XRE-family HTH domain
VSRVGKVVGERIRQAREMAGLSQAQVARLLGVHRPTITEMELGNRKVSAEELTRLAEIFEVSIAWLAGDTAEKLSPRDQKIRLAARELAKLKQSDLDRLLGLLASLKEEED